MTTRRFFDSIEALRRLDEIEDDDEVIGEMESSGDEVDVLEAQPESEYEESSDSDVPGPSNAPARNVRGSQRSRRRRAVAGRQRGRTRTTTPSGPQLNWQKVVNPRVMRQFSERIGVQKRFPPHTTSLDVFSQFITANVIALIVEMTNLNAERKIAASGGSQTWKPTTAEEVKAFLGLIIIMGLIRMPQLTMYWQKKNWIFDWPTPNKIIPRDRFKLLWKYLHFCDESKSPSPQDPLRDRLYKIRPLLELVEPTLLSVYTPDKYIAIDESMIPFKGRISFRQFIPSKRVRFGIKVWVLAESKTGYVSKFQIYTGKDPRVQEVGLASRVVYDLIDPFLDKGYHLYVDNFYISTELFRKLYENIVYACGTMRLGRKNFPSEVVLTKRTHTRGDSEWTMAHELLCQSWLDNRPVYFLSTIHKPDYEPDVPMELRTVKRRGGRGMPSQDMPCPPLLHDYNNYMGGVDFNDAMRKYYNIGRRSKTWYRRIFFYLIEVALHNSIVVAKAILPENERKKFVPLEWRKDLVTKLLGDFRTVRVPPRRSSEQLELRLQNVGLHLPSCESARFAL
uniref:piggyBac transposable element-derived protein 4-like n=1 Tax=Styela clava TaxID=7725 RepID=UPI001939D56C|nr:piggyBac transposable element-derived protein 4-like [Styela clava]